MFNKTTNSITFRRPDVSPLTSLSTNSRPLNARVNNTHYTGTYSSKLQENINHNTRNDKYEHKTTTRNFDSQRINGENSKIDDYEIGQLLGSGGFANVYRAVAKGGKLRGKEVAVKMINKERLEKNSTARHHLRSRVEEEVKHHKQLSHPSILALYDTFEDSKYVYLVMELCPKGELYKFINQRKIPLCEAEARGVMIQLIKGIQCMHNNGIMHRDLKLSNILLTEELDVKIADFGMSTNIFERGDEQKTICGTPNYISPEMVSQKPYGLAVDVWSLGVMFVTMLTGKPPFEDSKVQGTLDKVIRADYKLTETLSNEARDLINLLLQVDAQRRLPLSRILDHSFFNKSFPTKRLNDFAAVRSDFKYYAEGKSKGSSANVNYIPPSLSTSANSNRIYDSSKRNRLNTFRLKPQKQKTKHASVEILASGTLYLDFFDDRYLMTISNDGGKIGLFERPFGSTNLIMINPTKSYTLDELPSKYLRRYQFGYKVVDLVKRKTPKIIFFSPQAKCTLMENGPLADFEMCFQGQIKIYNSQSKGTLEIKIPSQASPGAFVTHKFITTGSKEPDYPRELLYIVKHMQYCLKQCLDIEKSGQRDPNTVYPLVLKSHRSHSEDINTQPLIHTTGTRSDNDGCTQDIRTRPFSNCSLSGRSMNMTCQFIVDLGWCIKDSGERFIILFEDGIRLVVEHENLSLKYYDDISGKFESYPIDRNLPQYVKDKLEHFPKFVKLFDQQKNVTMIGRINHICIWIIESLICIFFYFI